MWRKIMETQPDRTNQPFHENPHRANPHRTLRSHGGRNFAATVFVEAVALPAAKAAQWLGRQLVMRLVRALLRGHRQRRTRQILAALDDRMLKDIGISRSEIARIAAHMCQDQDVERARNNREREAPERRERPRRSSGKRRKMIEEDLFAPVPLQILQPHPCRPGALMVSPHPGVCCETC